ncbi:MAG: hypothetical protein QXG18_02785 [Candidatus Pacearchaeota archaeon]
MAFSVRTIGIRMRILMEITEETLNVYQLYKKIMGNQYQLILLSVRDLEQKGLVTTEKKGKRRFVKLTEKGKKVKELAEQLFKEVDLYGCNI